MNLLVYELLPALLLLIFGGLLATWILIAYRPDHKMEEVASRAGWAALALYLVWMGLVTFEQRQIPIATTGQMASFLGFLIWADQTYVQQKIRQKMLTLLPLASVCGLILIGMVAGIHPRSMPEVALGTGVAVHITLSLAGVAMLMGGGVYGAGYLILHNQMKRHTFGHLFSRLPSMEQIHRLRAMAIYGGWTLITVSLASAAVWMLLRKSPDEVVRSHLAEMSFLWAVVSVLAICERRRWLSQRKLAVVTVGLTGVAFVLVLWTMIAMFLRAAA